MNKTNIKTEMLSTSPPPPANGNNVVRRHTFKEAMATVFCTEARDESCYHYGVTNFFFLITYIPSQR